MENVTREERIAVYAGSFDPFTKGHYNLVKKTLKLFDRVIILIAHNPKKPGLFEPSERYALIAKSISEADDISDAGKIKIDILKPGLMTVNYCREVGAIAMIRSMRSNTEFEQEILMAHHNEKQNPDVETIFLKPEQSLEIVSSSAARDMASIKGDLSYMVTSSVEKALRDKFN